VTITKEGPAVLTVTEVAQILRLGKISVYQAIEGRDPMYPHRQTHPHPEECFRAPAREHPPDPEISRLNSLP